MTSFDRFLELYRVVSGNIPSLTERLAHSSNDPCYKAPYGAELFREDLRYLFNHGITGARLAELISRIDAFNKENTTPTLESPLRELVKSLKGSPSSPTIAQLAPPVDQPDLAKVRGLLQSRPVDLAELVLRAGYDEDDVLMPLQEPATPAPSQLTVADERSSAMTTDALVSAIGEMLQGASPREVAGRLFQEPLPSDIRERLSTMFARAGAMPPQVADSMVSHIAPDPVNGAGASPSAPNVVTEPTAATPSAETPESQYAFLPFEDWVELHSGKLETCQVPGRGLVVRLTIFDVPDRHSGLQEKMLELRDEVNRLLRPDNFTVHLAGGLTTQLHGDVAFVFEPCMSPDRVPGLGGFDPSPYFPELSQRQQAWTMERCEAMLALLDNELVPTDLVRLAGGLYRLDIAGRSPDLFNGRVILTKRHNSASVTATTYGSGSRGYSTIDNHPEVAPCCDHALGLALGLAVWPRREGNLCLPSSVDERHTTPLPSNQAHHIGVTGRESSTTQQTRFVFRNDS